jgi:hypothetical protein
VSAGCAALTENVAEASKPATDIAARTFPNGVFMMAIYTNKMKVMTSYRSQRHEDIRETLVFI